MSVNTYVVKNIEKRVRRSYRKPANLFGNMERAAGVEPATSSLGSWHSTTELRPLSQPKLSRTRPRISTALEISMTRAICDATVRDCEAMALDCEPTVWPQRFSAGSSFGIDKKFRRLRNC